MKKVKVITSTTELDAFLERTDINIIKTEVRGCEQSWFAQEYFVATIYYDDEPKRENTPDYWTRLEHQYAGMAMQGILAANATFTADDTAKWSIEYATALVEKLKNG